MLQSIKNFRHEFDHTNLSPKFYIPTILAAATICFGKTRLDTEHLKQKFNARRVYESVNPKTGKTFLDSPIAAYPQNECLLSSIDGYGVSLKTIRKKPLNIRATRLLILSYLNDVLLELSILAKSKDRLAKSNLDQNDIELAKIKTKMLIKQCELKPGERYEYRTLKILMSENKDNIKLYSQKENILSKKGPYLHRLYNETLLPIIDKLKIQNPKKYLEDLGYQIGDNRLRA